IFVVIYYLTQIINVINGGKKGGDDIIIIGGGMAGGGGPIVMESGGDKKGGKKDKKADKKKDKKKGGKDDKKEKGFIDRLHERFPDEKFMPVHRLDRPTSGMLLFAKDPRIANLLQRQFTEGTVRKRYLCAISGIIAEQKGVLKDPLKHPKTKQVQKAETQFSVVFQGDPELTGKEAQDWSILKVDLLTGRFHQIRRHFAYAGTPLIGEEKYISKDVKPGKRPWRRGLGLSAVQIQFEHPIKRKMMGFFELPEDDFGTWLRSQKTDGFFSNEFSRK
ncbi:MAG: RNA pseudouridine synthase, partial [Proteobacteria bacterium]